MLFVLQLFGVGFLLGCTYLSLLLREFEWRRWCKSTTRLAGKTVIITGGNSGIGKYTAIDLARRGARVIIACRNKQKADRAVEEIKRLSGSNNVVYRQLDLASLVSVRKFAEGFLQEEGRLDILVNNAGIGLARQNETTPEGHDITFGTNHFGHFLLTMLLLDRLKTSDDGRVITVSSNSYKFVKKMYMAPATDRQGRTIYPDLKGYARSKLANILFTRELAHRMTDTNISAYALTPGGVYTNIFETMFSSRYNVVLYKLLSPLLWLILQSEEQGAQTIIYCAVEESIRSYSGRCFNNCHLSTKRSALSEDDGIAKRLWDVSCDVTDVHNL